MTSVELQKIYMSRPFKTRNADEYDLSNILDLFIDPTDGLIGPFEYSNSIIKGKMGSGKTMYLRANYAYYLYTLVPCLLEQQPIILPVYIKLSDFQNIHDSEKLYYAIIVKIIEEIVSVCKHLQSSKELARLHVGAKTLSNLWSSDDTFFDVLERLKTLTADEYIERVSSGFATNGSVTASFLNLYAAYEKNTVTEIKRCEKPSFQNIVDVCDKLLAPFNGKLLLLFDEIGSISKSFFKASDDNDSYFETLMNQLRTLSYVRTKLAVYPHSYSDILKETRYGDVIELECDITNNNTLYYTFLSRTVSLIERYAKKSSGLLCCAEDIFDITTYNQLIIEQFVNASEGNMRRLVHLLDSSMNIAYMHCQGTKKVSLDDVLGALRKQGEEMESQYQDMDKSFLISLAKVCRTRSTYNFTFPNKSTLINRYTSTSSEYNVVNIKQTGTGRQGTVYSFDYAYCIYRDIPTHYVKDSEKIDRTRSTLNGEAIKRVAQLTDELLTQSDMRGKIEGTVTYLSEDNRSGFVTDSKGNQYYINMNKVIASDKRKRFYNGDHVRFLPQKVTDDLSRAVEVEIL